MDKALFIGMSGQSNSLRELEILSNNLANVNTPGFRADFETVKQHHIQEGGMETRVYSAMGATYTDFKQGPILRTGRDLDTAISGTGMFAVQSKSGVEGYTRAGDFEISGDGFLTTTTGNIVLGNNGAIQIPNSEKLEIGQDGTISVKPLGEPDMVVVGRLKLVNPNFTQLEKGPDGLFYSRDGAKIEADMNVKVMTGSLEGSNVNPVDTLIKLIDLSRQYEIHSNLIKNLAEQSVESNKLLDAKA
jgi:flagellar basal-body rod protein FlgF